MKKGKRPDAPSAKSRKCKFQRSKDSKWEDGVLYFDGDRNLAVVAKGVTILCPPYKVK